MSAAAQSRKAPCPGTTILSAPSTSSGRPLRTTSLATLRSSAARVSAFALVIAGAALVPGPLRAAEAGARVESERPPRPAARADAHVAGAVEPVA